ncbi:Lin0512 family protein [Halanaerobaculum tunisiense]
MEVNYAIQIGSGVDLHGQDMTKAACRAVKDAISNTCLSGVLTLSETGELEEMIVNILISVPTPDKVDSSKVLEVIPFGKKEIEVKKGGMLARGCALECLNDTDKSIIVANASVTVFINT